MNEKALKELLFKMADDQLILGHRNSEWTGIGPILEEDISFASMAQDKVGQSRVLYDMLHNLGEAEADTLAFLRNATEYRCCQLVELPIAEYDFSIIRHFLFDEAEYLRFQLLASSSYQPLALLAQKLKGELRYHVMHAETWLKQLGNADSDTILRMQKALEYAWPFALGIFEPSEFEQELIEGGIFAGEEELKNKWLLRIQALLSGTELIMPPIEVNPCYGGRVGKHTEYLQPLIMEMSEVFRLDPTAEW
jgi:ring-1,2-phenylacetyl-CoA epoxidase subunit PaaC